MQSELLYQRTAKPPLRNGSSVSAETKASVSCCPDCDLATGNAAGLAPGEHTSNAAIRPLEQARSQSPTIPPPLGIPSPRVRWCWLENWSTANIFSYSASNLYLYIYLDYKCWGWGGETHCEQTRERVQELQFLQLARSRWQGGALRWGSFPGPAGGSTRSLLMFRAHLPSNTQGEDTRTQARWKRQYHVATETRWVIPRTQLK